MRTDRDEASHDPADDAVGERDLRVAIVEALGDGFFRVDREGTILEVNSAFCSLIGYRADDVIGARVPHPWWFDDPESRARAAERLEALRAGTTGHVEFEEDLRTRDGGTVRVLASVSVLHSSGGEVSGLVGTLKDISDRAVEEERAQQLVELSEMLAPVVAEEEALDVILDGVMAIVELEGVGLFLPTADGDGLEPRRHRGMGWGEDEPSLPIGATLPPTTAFREGRAFLFSDAEQMVESFPEVRSFLNQRARQARASIPLRGRSGPTAVLHLLFGAERDFDAPERRFLRSIADRCGLALERAGIYESQRLEAERATRLQGAFAALAGASTPAQVARIVLHEAVPALGGRAGSVSLLDDSGAELRLVAHAGSDPSSAHGWDVLPIDADLPGTDAVRERTPVYLPDRDAIGERYPDQVGMSESVGDQAWAALPLMSGIKRVGLLFLNFVEAQTFDAPERLALEGLADRTAAAMDRARQFVHEHDVAVTLQHSLLPVDLVRRRTVSIATRYEAGADGLDVGGDWYDAIELPNGCFGLAVGDVVGRGLEAAASMGQLRSAMRALALRGEGPAAVLEGLDAFAQATEGTQMATVVYAELDPRTGELDYACAGHLPPVLLPRDGPARLLEDGRSPLLEVVTDGRPRPSASARMSDGDTLVLYTDGLTERRSEPIETGLQRMLAALSEATDLDPEGICDLLLRNVAPSGSRSDDVAMLCARFHAGVSFVASFPARPERLAEMRRTVSGWLDGTAADAQLRDDIVLAVNEACANAVEHARPRGGAGDVRIEAFAGDDLVFLVVDGGRWREASADPMRGRGLELIRSLVDYLVIDRSDGGTMLHLRWSHRRIGGAPWISR